MSREAFSKISPYITYEAMDLVLREWNAAKRWFEDVENEKVEAPEAEACEQACDLPNQYSLPCKCWLFFCIPEGIPIPLSLIHPRWLLYPLEVVIGWKMSFDRTIEVSDYYTMTGSTGDGDDGDMGPSNIMPPPPGYRYERKGAVLLENAALGAYDFHK